MKQTIRATQVLFLVFGIGISSWAPMIPLVKGQLALNEAELGLALLLFGLGALVSMPITPWLMNRMGSRVLTLVSGLCMLAAIPFLTVAPTLFLLGFALFFFGVATSSMNIAINAQAITIELQSQRTLMSGFHCLFSVGGLVGVTLVGFLLELHYNLISCGLLVSLVIFLAVITQYKKLLPDPPKPTSVSSTSLSFPEKEVFILGFLCFIACVAEGAMLDWSAEFLRTSFDYQEAQAGIGYAVFSAAMALGRFMGDRLIARFGAYTIFQAGSFLAASGFATLISAPMPYVELLGFFMIGIGAANTVPLLFSASGKFLPSHLSLTIVTSIGYVGLLMGPALVGFVAHALSLSMALSGIGALLFLAGIFGSPFLKRSKEIDVELLEEELE